MFGFLAAPLIGGFISNLFNNNNHHHNHCGGGHGGSNSAATNFALAREDFKDAAQDFARGDFRGGFEELAEAQQHLADANRHRWI
jgi:hypothetical protein